MSKLRLNLLVPASLKVRLVLIFAIVLILSLVGIIVTIGLFTSSAVGNFVSESEDASTTSFANAIVDSYHNDPKNFSQTLAGISKITDSSFIIVKPDSTTETINFPTALFPAISRILSLIGPPSIIGSTEPQKIIIATPLRDFGLTRPVSIVFVGSTQNSASILSISSDSAEGSFQRISLDIKPIQISQSELNQSILISIVVSAGVAGLLALVILALLIQRAFKPVTDLANAVENFGKGQFSQRVQEGGVKEIRHLSQTFNKMATRLQTTETMRQQLTADVAHELRTPLTSLKGYLEAIQDEVVEPSKDVVGDMQTQTEHLNKIVNDLALIATVDSGHLSIQYEVSDLAKLTQEIVRSFQPITERRKLSLSYEGPHNLEFNFDTVRVRQIINNLVANAITHTPAEGSIVIAIKIVDSMIEIAISDSGEGISPEHLDNIMERFYRVDQSRSRLTGGSGLGLTIVKKLTELHGGSVRVSSKLGSGSTFTISLPSKVS